MRRSVRNTLFVGTAIVGGVGISYLPGVLMPLYWWSNGTLKGMGLVSFENEQFARRWSVSESWHTTVVGANPVPSNYQLYPNEKKWCQTGWTVPSWSAALQPWQIESPADASHAPDFSVVDVGVGFPFRSTAYREVRRVPGTPGHRDDLDPQLSFNGTVLSAQLDRGTVWHQDHQKLPLATYVLWPGFLLNMLFWSIVIAAPWWLRAGFVSLRARRRRQAGRCPKCGYMRSGIAAEAPCPECGEALRAMDA